MKLRSLVAVYMLILVPILPAHGTDAPAPRTNPSFEMMKGLVGEWQGTSAEGKSITTSYQMVAAGSALMERQAMGDAPEMITVYHCDGNKLLMTHYCSLGNQPRMRARSAGAGAKALQFDFVDATNMAARDAPCMRGLVVKFDDPDHVTQEWTLRDKGKDQVMAIKLERKK